MEIIETPAPPRGTKIKHGAKEQQNEYEWCFILAIRNIGLQHRDGKWNYLLSRKQIENVLPLPAWYCSINFWIVTFGNIKTLNNFFLGFEYPYKQQNNIISPLGIELHYEWIYKFSFELTPAILHWKLNQLHLTVHFSISWTATLFLTIGKTKHFLFENATLFQKCF